MAKKVLDFAKDVAKGIAKDLTTKTDKSGGKDSFNDTRRQSMQRTKRSERVKAGKPTTGKKVKTTFDKKYGNAKSNELSNKAASKAAPKETVDMARSLYKKIDKAPKKAHAILRAQDAVISDTLGFTPDGFFDGKNPRNETLGKKQAAAIASTLVAGPAFKGGAKGVKAANKFRKKLRSSK